MKRDDRKLKLKRRRGGRRGGASSEAAQGSEVGPRGTGPIRTGRPDAQAIVAELQSYRQSFQSETSLELSDKVVRSLALYVTELFKWNDRAALISRYDETRVVERHIMDSLSLLAFLRGTEGTSVLDIGSGAGFPGIPLKIAARGLAVTLVESVRKKQLFLAYVTEKLGLSGVRILCDRAEDAPWRGLAPEGFDVVISRAALSLKDFAAVGGPAVARGGLLVAYKGARYEAELSDAQETLSRMRLRLVTVWASPWGPGMLPAFQRER